MVNKHETSRSRRLTTTAAGFMAAGMISSCTHAASHEQPTLHQQAEVLAMRYKGSTVAVVKDMHRNLPNTIGQGRTTSVEVTMDLAVAKAARPLLKKYVNDNDELWSAPVIGADIETGITKNNPYGTFVANNETAQQNGTNPNLDGTVITTLYPGTHYPDGTVADIYVAQDIMYGADSATKPQKEIVGVDTIGTMVLRHGEWQLSKQAPAIQPHIRAIN